MLNYKTIYIKRDGLSYIKCDLILNYKTIYIKRDGLSYIKCVA